MEVIMTEVAIDLIPVDLDLAGEIGDEVRESFSTIRAAILTQYGPQYFKIRESYDIIERKAKAVVVDSPEAKEYAVCVIREAKREQDEAKKLFRPFIKLQNDALKSTRAAEKHVVGGLKDIEATLKKKCVDYDREIERQRRKAEEEVRRQAIEEARRQAEAEKNDEPALPPPVKPAVPVPEKTKIDGASMRTAVEYDIIDEDKIPDQFFKRVLDKTKLRKHINAHADRNKSHDPDLVPGVIVRIEKTMAVS